MAKKSCIAIFIVSKIRKSGRGFLFSDPFLFFAMSLSEYFEKSIFVCPRLGLNNNSFPSKKYHTVVGLPDSIEILQVRPLASMAGFFLCLPMILIGDLYKYIKAIIRADVIFLRLPAPPCIIAFFLAKIFRKTVVTYYASDIKNVVFSGNKYEGTIRPLARFAAVLLSGLLRHLVEKSDGTIFLSKALLNKHKQKNSFYAFASLVSENDIVEKQDKTLPGRELSIVYAGRLSHEKGLVYLLKTLAILGCDGIDARLTLCGEGPCQAELEKLGEELGINNRLVFKGHISERKSLWEIFSAHDIFVLPSISEGTPKVLIEAMAKGLVVVATKVGGVPDIITDKENGLLVSTKSDVQIARAIKELIQNKTLRNRLIRNGYECALNYTEAQQARKISEIIKEIIWFKERGSSDTKDNRS